MKLTKTRLKQLIKEELQKLYEDDDSCEPGATFTADDGCNTCTCPESGKKSEASCTEKACGDESDFGKFNENVLNEEAFTYRRLYKTLQQVESVHNKWDPRTQEGTWYKEELGTALAWVPEDYR
tara:strand:+ start:304 stop:675 length:372 start_codon:yes stop_codon:yes gene_type:complete